MDLKSVEMNVTPRVTQAIRRKYAVLGVDPNEQNRTYPLNARSVVAIVVYCSCVSSTSAFLLLEAETFRSYIDSVSITSATIIDSFVYLSFFFRFGQFSTFVNSIEEIFQESEYLHFIISL